MLNSAGRAAGAKGTREIDREQSQGSDKSAEGVRGERRMEKTSDNHFYPPTTTSAASHAFATHTEMRTRANPLDAVARPAMLRRFSGAGGWRRPGRCGPSKGGRRLWPANRGPIRWPSLGVPANGPRGRALATPACQ
jgi:hypothetical protein